MLFKSFLSFVLVLLLVFFSCEQQEPVAPVEQNTLNPEECLKPGDLFNPRYQHGGITVMTRNIYVGTDVDMVMMATTPEEVLLLSTQAFQMLLSTNFAGRAELLANEIQKTKPDLIGLQEVTLFCMQSPGDLMVGGTAPATQPFLDYLGILLNALSSRGLDYKVAGIIEDTDVEVPVIMEVDENGNPALINDFRMTDYDVVLAKNGVKIDKVESANYQARYDIPSMGATILRGYVVVDTKIKNRHYRFVSTHLEPAVSPELLQVQMGQVMELTSILQDNSLPQIVVGDFNAEYPASPIYDYMIDNGYIDVWIQNWIQNDPDGFTYGHDLDLRNAEANFNKRLDYIFVKDSDRQKWTDPFYALVIGKEPWNRFKCEDGSLLWPSDHGGVVAKLNLSK
jgi:endonuclease/exonuclease/phosphatase family metal-dependent hydrolase